MRYYETLYLINPNLPDEEYRDILTKFNDLVEKNNGVIVNIDEWGKKSLAYEIKKNDKGYYVLLQYCGQGDMVAEIEHGMQLDERILKFQTIKLSDQEDPEILKVKIEEDKKKASERAEVAEAETLEEDEDSESEND